MDLPANRRAHQVRQVLSSRGLTLYRVSELSAEFFGRSSLFHVPHNLSFDAQIRLDSHFSPDAGDQPHHRLSAE